MDRERANTEDDDTLQNSPARYLAYVGRFSRVLVKLPRAMVHTSEVGEVFRPVVSKNLVLAAHGISWAYIGADVLLGAYYSYERGDRTSTISRVIAERLSFHSIASVILPGIVIHQSLHSFEHDLNRRVALAKRNSSISRKLWVPSPIALRWGPTAIALTLIPFLPLAFDEPVEWATAKAFDVMWPVHRERSAE